MVRRQEVSWVEPAVARITAHSLAHTATALNQAFDNLLSQTTNSRRAAPRKHRADDDRFYSRGMNPG